MKHCFAAERRRALSFALSPSDYAMKKEAGDAAEEMRRHLL